MPNARAATSFISLLYTGFGYCAIAANGDIFYKLDGGAWTLSTTIATSANGAACDGVRIIIVGDLGYIIESLDGGVTWSAVANGFGTGLLSGIDNRGEKPSR